MKEKVHRGLKSPEAFHSWAEENTLRNITIIILLSSYENPEEWAAFYLGVDNGQPTSSSDLNQLLDEGKCCKVHPLKWQPYIWILYCSFLLYFSEKICIPVLCHICTDHLEVKIFRAEDIMSSRKQHDTRRHFSPSTVICLFRDLGTCWSGSCCGVVEYLFTVRLQQLVNSFHSLTDASLHFYQKCPHNDGNSLVLIYISIFRGLAWLVSSCVLWTFCVRGIYIERMNCSSCLHYSYTDSFKYVTN